MHTWRRTLVIACVVSGFIHLALILNLQVEAPEQEAPAPHVIEARLAPMKPVEPVVESPTPVVVSPPEKPKHRARRIPRTLPEHVESPVEMQAPAETPPIVEQAPPAESPVATEPSVEAPPVAEAPQAGSLPSRLLIRFSVSWGGLSAGQAEYRWERTGNRYDLQSFTKTTGLVGLLKSMWLVQTSVGDITENGLRPDTFVNHRSDKPSESATFDWPEQSLQLMVDGVASRKVSLLPGAQDLMSVLFQFAFSPPKESELQLAVVTGRKLDTYHFSIVGEETLQLPFGDVRTLHVRRAVRKGDDSLDVWLAPERHYLPVRIVRTDRKDNAPVELIASELLVASE